MQTPEAVVTEADAIQQAADEGEAAAAQETKLTSQPSPAATRKGTAAAAAFQRVKAEEWVGKKGAWDNSYRASFGESGWGAKAQAVLGQVRKMLLCAILWERVSGMLEWMPI